MKRKLILLILTLGSLLLNGCASYVVQQLREVTTLTPEQVARVDAYVDTQPSSYIAHYNERTGGYIILPNYIDYRTVHRPKPLVDIVSIWRARNNPRIYREIDH